ncbi:MAG: ATP-binding protein, partial [Cyanobacteriota bacterium]
AYSLIPEAAKQGLHLRVGQLLLQNTPSEELEQKLFDIINQLNLGRTLIRQQTKRDQLAQLNLKAGKKAKASAAYQPAFNYLEVGLGLLGEDSWHSHYDLSLEIYVEAAEAAFLIANFDEMERLTEIVLQQAQTLLDRVAVYEIKHQAYYARNKPLEAVKTALDVLKLLGVVFPDQPSESDFVLALQATQSALAGRQALELIELPKMTEPLKLAIMGILVLDYLACYLASPSLFPLIALKLVNLSLKYGNAPESAFGYVTYGLMLCASLGDIEAGYQFGQLALHLSERFNAKQFIPKVSLLANNHIRPWKEHIRDTLSNLLEGYQIALETGDWQYAAMTGYTYCLHLYLIGRELTEVEKQMTKYGEAIAQTKQEGVLHWHQMFWQLVLNLIDRTEEPSHLKGELYDETKMLPIHLEANDQGSLFNVFLIKITLHYLFQDIQQAFEDAIKIEEYLNSASGPFIPIRHFYDSLIRLAVFPNVPEAEQQDILKKVAANQEKMETWAHHAPMNCLHKFYLVEAERARVLGNDADAREYYDKAIALAHENEYLNEEALAYELAGRFYIARNQNHVARHYLQDAHYAYLRWGATAKVKDLETRYPQFLAQTATSSHQGTVTSSTTNSGQRTSSSLDLDSVLKASQAISGEIVLDKLLEKLMKFVIENAGAQKGFLILEQDGNWAIEAEASVGEDEVSVMRSLPIDAISPSTQLPLVCASIINYVAHTKENVVLNDATHEGQFTRDPYIVATQPKSILCTPLCDRGKLSGILYLENNLTTNAFTRDRVETLKILSAQAAISIENSRLYEQLEDYSRTLEIKVDERTHQLQEKNDELAATLQKLKATQDQIIAQEKLASLGALTAGIAHEIKNPLNFVNNFAELSAELTEELLEEIENQKDRLDAETTEYIEEVLSDLQQNVKKINEHGKRADSIVRGMLMHSRGKAGERELTDINALLAEYINLAYHGMRAKDTSFNITIETNYDNFLGLVNVVPQDISRVFLNIVNNACYSTHEKKKEIDKGFFPTLWVSTKNLGEQVEICIRDNGKGIPEKFLDKIFNPFFTTKPTGQGTGLGLSITHDIIVQQHRGEIKVKTEAGQYAEFTIILPKRN